jgi:hypothetical protein
MPAKAGGLSGNGCADSRGMGAPSSIARMHVAKRSRAGAINEAAMLIALMIFIRCNRILLGDLDHGTTA